MRNLFIPILFFMLLGGFTPSDLNQNICPEATEGQKIKDWLKNCDDLSIFTSILESHEMLERLEGEENWMVMAPVNEAFTELEDEDLERFMEDKQLQRNILNRHLQQNPSSFLSPEVQMTEFRGTGNDGRTRNIGNAEVKVRNITLANGTVHIVGDLIWAEARRVRK